MNKEELDKTMEQRYIFALDIGTRSVIGIVGKKEGDLFHVVDTEMVEHTKRAMIDGQIEDIEQVAKVSAIVKERLEQRLDTTFDQVCVAAAGRALKTSRACFELELNAGEPISSQLVYELEIGAIERAHDEIRREFDNNPLMRFYCVGYSVIRYHLDDYPIATLLNHRGRKARVEVIATFLPNEVVESLCTTMSMIHLNIAYLTLEPIAAMNAVIPPELRLLNLALVDIGAGTSDIAISNEGSVSAYTMATVAGDELTETLIKHFLIDFQTAEKMKISCGNGEDSISYKDILGFDYSVSLAEVMDVLRPAIDELGHVICDKILESNGKAPAAVFLVGGGSKIPMLCEVIAQILEIDKRKVAVGGNNYMKRLMFSKMDLSDPEYATPMGIALTASACDTRDGFYVFINGNKIRMFRNSALTVMDVLLMSGYKYSQLMGKSGKSVTFELNGQKKLVRGGYPEPAKITVNDLAASITTPVKCGDKLVIEPSVSGEDVVITVADVIGKQTPSFVVINGARYGIGEWATVNGLPASYDQEIHDLDTMESFEILTLEDLCVQTNTTTAERRFYVNGEIQLLEYVLNDGDDIYWEIADQPAPKREQQSLPEPQCEPVMPEELHNEQETPVLPENKIDSKVLNIFLNQKQVELYPKVDGTKYLFLDMLNFVNIDPTKPQGNIILKINGKDASYLEAISDGDAVEICWAGKDGEIL